MEHGAMQFTYNRKTSTMVTMQGLPQAAEQELPVQLVGARL